jgi:hypothetical protein
MDWPADLSDGRVGKIEFTSASPFEIHHILCKICKFTPVILQSNYPRKVALKRNL